MILAAGRGERMRPLTDALPKPLLVAGGKPLIVWHLLRLARAGFREVVVNHAWLGSKIEAALGDGSQYGLHLRYSAEGEALETAGGIAQALPLLTGRHAQASATAVARAPDAEYEPFLVVNGDVFCDFDFARAATIALQMKYTGLGCWCVMVPNPPHHRTGDFELADGLLADSAARPSGECPARGSARLTYAGIGFYTPAMFDGIERGSKASLRPLLEREMAAGRAGGEYHPGLWFDIGTAERLAELDRLLASRSITVGVRDG